MWSQYDEDLSQNDFFKEIKKNHEDILKRAAEEHWIICIPRRGSLKSDNVSMNLILDHILVPNSESQYTTLNKKDVSLENHHLKIDQNNIFHNVIQVLFEETHYIEQSAKYIVWCVNWPLFLHQNYYKNNNNNNVNVVLVTIQDCIDFLYSEAFGHNILEEIQTLCVDFWNRHENTFETDTLQSQKDYLGTLYSQCLQLCFKSEIIRDKCNKNVRYLDNLKLSIETYMQYCLGKKLIYSINTLHHLTDCTISKILRNSVDITLSDLNISSDFSDFVVDATFELSRINNFITVLDKLHCLSKTFNIFNNKSLQNDQKLYVTSDDFLQILVYLILQSNIPNWFANLTYLKEFQFATFGNADQTNFLVTSLEAALAFINSPQFLFMKQSVERLEGGPVSIFDKIYIKFKDQQKLADLDLLLANETEKDSAVLCHPLCSCLKCDKIHCQKFDSKPHKILNNFSQNFVIMASIENNTNFLEFLLTLDYDINFKDMYGKTALHHAAEKGFQDILLVLINAKANVNIQDNDRNTALHLACDRGHESCVKAFIYSSHFIEVNLQNISGETPLFLATRWGYFDVIKILLENGASVCLKNNNNISVYKLSPNFYITKLFRQFGTYKSNNIKEEVINDKRAPFDNVLNVSEDCSSKMLGSLQTQGLLFGTHTKSDSQSKKVELLLRAIVNNDLPLTCFYLGYSSDFTDNHSNKSCTKKKCHPLCTCTDCSNREDCEDTTDSSLNHFSNNKEDKFNVNMCNKEGFTPLHMAARYGRTDILRVLLDSGALLNVCTNINFYTPLHLAVMFQRVQTVKELLQCGNCKVDAQDYKGNTPLYYACACNSANLKIIELLLQNGANCRKKNFEEKTVLQICEEKNLFRICRMLRESMGYHIPKTKEGSTPGSSNSTSSNISFEDIDSDFEFL